MIKLTYPQMVSGFRFGYAIVPYQPEFREYNNNSVAVEKREILNRICRYLSENVKPPICIPFSGGVDSTIMLLAAMQCYHPKNIKCLTVYFDDFPQYDESETARKICDKLGIYHQAFGVDIEVFNDVLDKVDSNNYHRWFYSSSLVPTYYAIRESFRIGSIVTGDGGDELYCGYDRYVGFAKMDNFPKWAWKLIRPPKSESPRRLRKFREAQKFGYRGLVSLWGEKEAEELFDVDWLPEFDQVAPAIMDYPLEIRGNSLEKLMWYDIQTELFGLEAEKVATARRMVQYFNDGQPVNLYSPFMAKKDLPLYFATRPEYKYRHGQKKWILREIIRDFLPDYDLISPMNKRGFAAPVSQWARNQPLSRFMIRDGLLNDKKIKEIYKKNIFWEDYGECLWGLAVWKELLKKGMVEVE